MIKTNIYVGVSKFCQSSEGGTQISPILRWGSTFILPMKIEKPPPSVMFSEWFLHIQSIALNCNLFTMHSDNKYFKFNVIFIT